MNPEEIRKKIDLIDFRLIKLISQRMELSLKAAKTVDGGESLLRAHQEVNRYFRGLMDGKFEEDVFRLVGERTRKLLANPPGLIGFQGEHGAFGEVAARGYCKDLAPIPCLEFVDVFDGVEKGQLDLGIVPVENSLQGAVTHVNDLLIERDLKIVGEIDVPITHCLLALPDTDYREIKVAYSHPQALAQCRGFLARNRLEPRPFYDTAGAARMISRERPNGAAAIASSLCARLYNLQVIKESIEDHPSNYTRFVIIARDYQDGPGQKCSIVFSTAHKVGTLYQVLQTFAEASLNLTRIESRPIRQDPGSYAFLLDFKGSGSDPEVVSALEKVKSKVASFKYLGCYGQEVI